MAVRRAALLMVATVLASACSGGSDDGADGLASAGATDTSASATTAATTLGVGGTAEPASNSPASAVECEIVDDGTRFQVVYRNDGTEAVTLAGAVGLTLDDGSALTSSIEVPYVLPGESVREGFFSSKPSEARVEGCSTEAVAVTSTPVLAFRMAEVSGCDNVREVDLGSYGDGVTVTNRSQTVPAYYLVKVALRDAGGERRESRTVLGESSGGGGGVEDLAPGQTVTKPDQSLSSRFDEIATCEIVAAQRKAAVRAFEFDDEFELGSPSVDIAFGAGSAEITAAAGALLDELVGPILADGGPVCAAGFADSVGASDENQNLSQERAEAVAAFLQAAGVVNEITTVGYGDDRLGTDEVADQLQRRAEVALAACPTRP